MSNSVLRNERFHDKKPRSDGDDRTAAQRDRDRILYSSSFRRLAEVTQVVSANSGYVFHNRLTHSLQVAQVGRRLAEKLVKRHPNLAAGNICPDVVKAACLAHDLGHPPSDIRQSPVSTSWPHITGALRVTHRVSEL